MRIEFVDLSGNSSLRMNNKFPNEKLAGLEALKLEVWGAFCREFQFLLGYLAGELLEKKGYALSFAICFGTSGQQLFTESHHKLQGSLSSLGNDFFSLKAGLILLASLPFLTSIFEV